MNNFAMKLFLILVTLLLAKVVHKFITKATGLMFRNNRTFLSLLNDFIKYLIWLMAFGVILSLLGFEKIALTMGGFIAVLGLVLVQTLTNFIQDLIAGIFLMVDQDFQVGFKVRITDIVGTVESLDLRKTKIRDLRGNLYILPNAKVDAEVVILSKDEK